MGSKNSAVKLITEAKKKCSAGFVCLQICLSSIQKVETQRVGGVWRLPKVDLLAHMFIRRNHHLAVFVSSAYPPLSHALTFCPVHWKPTPTLSSTKDGTLPQPLLEPIVSAKLLWKLKLFACLEYFLIKDLLWISPARYYLTDGIEPFPRNLSLLPAVMIEGCWQ